MSDGTTKTIWLWPTGTYPRRVLYYLRAKQLSSRELKLPHNPTGQLDLIPTNLDMGGGLTPAGLMPCRSGVEDRPKGTQMPAIRISSPDKPDAWIRESTSVLEYLEEIYPSAAGYRELRGETPEARGNTRDVINVVSELLVWTNVCLRHTNELLLAWSGLSKEEQNVPANMDALRQSEKLLIKIEVFLRGRHGATATLADFALLASVEYLLETYQWDLLDGFGWLKEWHEVCKTSDWYVSLEEVKEMEEKASLEMLFSAVD